MKPKPEPPKFVEKNCVICGERFMQWFTAQGICDKCAGRKK